MAAILSRPQCVKRLEYVQYLDTTGQKWAVYSEHWKKVTISSQVHTVYYVRKYFVS